MGLTLAITGIRVSGKTVAMTTVSNFMIKMMLGFILN